MIKPFPSVSNEFEHGASPHFSLAFSVCVNYGGLMWNYSDLSMSTNHWRSLASIRGSFVTQLVSILTVLF